MRRRVRSTSAPEGVPAELLYPDDPVWHDQTAYRAFIEAHRWPLSSGERMGGHTSPANRRNDASLAWAAEHGVALAPGRKHADLHRLREMGLYGAPGDHSPTGVGPVTSEGTDSDG